MSLSDYQSKRSFSKTPEPEGKKPKKGGSELVFVVQKHHASHLHYDFRLEMKGMLKSWAIPKGPSMNPADKRLALLVEDHPFDYKDFEGVIPEGNYGAGTVIIWDQGTYEPAESKNGKAEQEKVLLREFYSGSLRIRLNGNKIKGEFALVQAKGRGDNSWLLIKKQDEYAGETDITTRDKSVVSGKTIEEIRNDKKSRKWISNRNADGSLKPAKDAGSGMRKPANGRDEPTGAEDDYPALIEELLSSLGIKKRAPVPPDFQPMIPTSVEAPGDEQGWTYEVLWDGLRAIASCNKGEVDIISAKGKAVGKKYSPILDALRDWPVNAVLDGEIVVINDEGLSSFGDLQRWRGDGDGELVFYVFDILWLEGAVLANLPLRKRREILEQLLPGQGVVRLSEQFETSGSEFFGIASNMKLKGIIAKRSDSTYVSGTMTGDWLEIRTEQRQKEIKKVKAPVKSKPVREKAHVFLNPKDDTQTKIVNGHELKFSNLSKVYWPKEKITKRDMLNYYFEVMPFMLPYMKDRPQSLNRHPNGITGENFYQKNVSGKVDPWITTHDYQNTSKEGSKTFLVCTDEASLLYIAKLGCIEMNPWHSRLSSPDNPDWCVIDLDPDTTNTFEQIIEVANVVKKILDAIEVPCFPKTSGSTGMHLYIPLGAKYDYDQSKQLAELIVTLTHQELPGYTSVERNPAKRKGKIYLDFLQNRPIQTIAAPYSLRPKPGATASAPLRWEEVKNGLSIQQFNIGNMIQRIKENGDLFTGLLGEGIDLGKVLEKAGSVFG